EVAILGDTIAAVDADLADVVGPETEVVDATRLYVAPGLIDAHIHTYESHLSITHISAAMLRRGMTTISTDFYGEAVVGGVDAVRASVEASKAVPLNVVFTVPMPAYYQDTPFVHTGTLNEQLVHEMLDWDECNGIDECFAPYVLARDENLLSLIDRARAQG